MSATAMHTVHEAGLHQDCPACLELAEDPVRNLDHENLSRVVELASMRGDRFGQRASEPELVAAAKCLTVLEQAGKMLETNAPAVLWYFREAWRIDLGGPSEQR